MEDTMLRFNSREGKSVALFEHKDKKDKYYSVWDVDKTPKHGQSIEQFLSENMNQGESESFETYDEAEKKYESHIPPKKRTKRR